MRKIALAFLLLASPASATPADLHAAVQAACGCQIVGISFGSLANSATWVIQYGPSVTPAQQSLAQAALIANAAMATAAAANPLASLQAALIAAGTITQTQINAAATSASPPTPTPSTGIVPPTPVP